MAVRRPTLDQLRSVAEDLGMHMGDEELKSYDALMQANYAAYEAVDAMPDYVPAVKYPRTPGYRPEGEENKYNAWYVKTEIKGAPSGKLAGKTVALKDNICLAGVPMMNGASTLEGYIARHRRDHRHPHARCRRHHSSARSIANISASPAAATPVRPARCTIRTRWAIRPAARRRAARSWSRPAKSTWRSAATRADRSAFRRPSAASTA